MASCTIQKRMFLPGYHVEYKKNNPKFANETVTIIDNSAQKNHLKNENVNLFTKNIKNNAITPDSKDTFRLIENINIVPINNLFNLNQKEKITISKNKVLNKSISFSDKKIVNSNKKNKRISKPNNDSNSATRGLGWVIFLIGLGIAIFISLLVGLILMFLGLLFIIAGGNKKNNSVKEKSKPDQYIEVVYLKNGSIIRGIIIEQTPNVQIKIQTKDGSVFVYKMDEVEKITKELEK